MISVALAAVESMSVPAPPLMTLLFVHWEGRFKVRPPVASWLTIKVPDIPFVNPEKARVRFPPRVTEALLIMPDTFHVMVVPSVKPAKAWLVVVIEPETLRLPFTSRVA